MDEQNTSKKSVVALLQGKKKVLVVAVAIILVLIIGGTVVNNLGSGAGSTVGNLRNGGFAAQGGSWVYYLKVDDRNIEGIYKVRKNGTKGEQVTKDTDYGSYLNVDGNYIYYIDSDNDDLVRIKTNGKDKSERLEKDVDNFPITVHKGWVYYAKDGDFCRTKANGKGNRERISKKDIASYQIEGNWIYHTEYKNGDYRLSRMKLDGTKTERISDELKSPSFYVKGGNIYYVNAEINSKTWEYTYELYSMKTNGNNANLILEFEENDIAAFNMTDEGIYYIAENNDDDGAIFFVKYNGKNKKEIITLEDAYYSYTSRIVVLDGWIYYFDENDDGDTAMFKVRTNGKNKAEI